MRRPPNNLEQGGMKWTYFVTSPPGVTQCAYSLQRRRLDRLPERDNQFSSQRIHRRTIHPQFADWSMFEGENHDDK